MTCLHPGTSIGVLAGSTVRFSDVLGLDLVVRNSCYSKIRRERERERRAARIEADLAVTLTSLFIVPFLLSGWSGKTVRRGSDFGDRNGCPPPFFP